MSSDNTSVDDFKKKLTVIRQIQQGGIAAERAARSSDAQGYEPPSILGGEPGYLHAKVTNLSYREHGIDLEVEVGLSLTAQERLPEHIPKANELFSDSKLSRKDFFEMIKSADGQQLWIRYEGGLPRGIALVVDKLK